MAKWPTALVNNFTNISPVAVCFLTFQFRQNHFALLVEWEDLRPLPFAQITVHNLIIMLCPSSQVARNASLRGLCLRACGTVTPGSVFPPEAPHMLAPEREPYLLPASCGSMNFICAHHAGLFFSRSVGFAAPAVRSLLCSDPWLTLLC